MLDYRAVIIFKEIQMLISQRIAKDINFLKPILGSKESRDCLLNIRLDIIHSTKFIVGRELFDSGTTSEGLLNRLFGDNRKTHNDKIQNRLNTYGEYLCLPFPSIVIENDTGLLLLISSGPLCWDFFSVSPNGVSCPFYTTVSFPGKNTETMIKAFSLVSDDVIEKRHADRSIEWRETMFSTLSGLVVTVSEILLFMNVKNIKHIRYTPTKKENAAVPKVLQPKYTYHILDLFKQKKVYTSLDGIEEDLCKPRRATELRRAVLVRGHFKQRKTGIFFWDHYTRNKHNAETHGIVDKDYRVHAPRELLLAV